MMIKGLGRSEEAECTKEGRQGVKAGQGRYGKGRRSEVRGQDGQGSKTPG